jgi:hypothetical protein
MHVLYDRVEGALACFGKSSMAVRLGQDIVRTWTPWFALLGKSTMTLPSQLLQPTNSPRTSASTNDGIVFTLPPVASPFSFPPSYQSLLPSIYQVADSKIEFRRTAESTRRHLFPMEVPDFNATRPATQIVVQMEGYWRDSLHQRQEY